MDNTRGYRVKQVAQRFCVRAGPTLSHVLSYPKSQPETSSCRLRAAETIIS